VRNNSAQAQNAGGTIPASALASNDSPGCGGGVISLGSGPDGKRIRRKVSGQTKAIVSDRRHPHRGSAAQALADLA